jgi:regulator of sigma E protease
MIYTTLFRLIIGFFYGPNLFKYISGPVGIFEATSQAAGLGVGYLANLIAFISLNLAAINIFPFPALDGGRVIFLIIEKIKGSPVSAKIQQIVNGVGFALLIALILAVSVQDIGRLF